MGICVSCRRRERKAPEKRSAGGGLAARGAELLPRRAAVLAAMANSISNIKMTNPIKGFVSKRRRRYIQDGFNLDLAYITDRLIAMGFPAEKLEGVYRNHIDEVYRFLELKHRDHYKIYNLCSERSYDSSKFHERVERYAFEDHSPPKIELIQPFCEDVHRWLSAHPGNVAAVHCKAGKGRTGTMVCCYLLYSGQKATADEALNFYGTKRAHDKKGVTIPSQRRYVEYYAALLRGGLSYRPCALHIRELVLSPAPALNGQAALELAVVQHNPPLKAPSGCHEVRKHDNVIRMPLNHCTPVSGDVRVEVYNKPMMRMRKEKLFHFWFNTFFVANQVGAVAVPPPLDSLNLETFKLTLNKWQLDDAHKDKTHKLYHQDFKVELILQKQPDSSKFSARPAAPPRAAASPPSSSDSSGSDRDDDDEHWDSGASPVARYRQLTPEPELDNA
ncbi:phosphatidylinositol 3,4,5-trisphosphate 3-phosphatase and dual-specificity protein phosphatase PTEN isoform X2 [Plutella xylostella]|uniref:phosphatidylinositol 3,4,5-trisphosphate 3-phosphatase and dual-specificity protein phosphatase PTEN isoform X2 n=1 Tax=Plutella xylostella TaxID=51655 RepID=UPI0018D050A5|nr:phosphatidylinositol 3,4,5-trisphosphate 3-phosphatase and dual-specificity protein phosphatase PTEN isoform X2 [Plutella xylostella]